MLRLLISTLIILSSLLVQSRNSEINFPKEINLNNIFLNHRVKNNSQVITSHFNIKINSPKTDELTLISFQEAQNRVQSTTVNKKDDSSIGLTLIELLSNQIKAKFEFKKVNQPEYGFWFSIEGKFK